MKKLILIGLISLLAITACSDFYRDSETTTTPPRNTDGNDPFGKLPNPNQGTFTREKLLLNIGLNFVVPHLKDFAFQTELLRRRVNEMCPTIDTPREDQTLIQSQLAWKETMLTWHRLKAAEFGPVLDNNGEISLKVYSWPLVNHCGVDRLVVDLKRTGKPERKLGFTSQGLAALEYLLFEPSLNVQCNLNASPQEAAWNQLPASEKRLDRCRAAQFLAEDLESIGKALLQKWDPQQGNYSKRMISASNLRDVVNMVSDSLFYIEKVKDRKLAQPLGMTSACQADRCLETAEHPWTDIGLQAIEANLVGLSQIFWGQKTPNAADGIAFGFDDYLVTAGRADLTEQLSAKLRLALERAKVVSGKGGFKEQLRKTVAGECGELCELHQEVRDLSRLLKTDFLTALDLRPPRTIEGDND